jgi:hypothetical protein
MFSKQCKFARSVCPRSTISDTYVLADGVHTSAYGHCDVLCDAIKIDSHAVSFLIKLCRLCYFSSSWLEPTVRGPRPPPPSLPLHSGVGRGRKECKYRRRVAIKANDGYYVAAV